MERIIQDLLHSLENRQKIMVDQLHQFSAINSGTENLQGLSSMLEALKKVFHPLADQLQMLSFAPINIIDIEGNTTQFKCGDALFIRKRPHLKRRILLCGHMDTVYAANHPFQTSVYLDSNTLNGPGVADMKGGLIVMLHALSAFEEAFGATSDLGWDVFINADEEIGSPSSGMFYPEIAADYGAALVYEPTINPLGTLAKNRRGSGKLTLIATGIAAHVGRAFSKGRNAICYLAEALVAINQLNGLKEGITINVGKISGGSAVNMVPDKAVAKLDIRIKDPEDEHWVLNQLDLIIKKLKREGYLLTFDTSFGRPPKQVGPGTERLFNSIQKIGQQLKISIDWEDSGGCCDGNNLAQSLPVIDTLGVRGGNIHSQEEYILLDSLVERTALSTLLLVNLDHGGLEGLCK